MNTKPLSWRKFLEKTKKTIGWYRMAKDAGMDQCSLYHSYKRNLQPKAVNAVRCAKAAGYRCDLNQETGDYEFTKLHGE